jgi:sterol desaturase/sphingolipid hydroxylase (fatty acid hydroxylase superfamily)
MDLEDAFAMDQEILAAYKEVVAVLKEYVPWLHAVFQPVWSEIKRDAFAASTQVPLFMLGALTIFALEKWIPARKEQPIFSKGLVIDGIWWFMTFYVFILALYFVYGEMDRLFDTYLGFLAFDFPLGFPVWLQIVFALLLSDFVRWFHHFVRHKVPLFWQFHAIHHSQREMNFFTCLRVHPFDRLAARIVSFIPFAMFLPSEIAVPTLVGWHFVLKWHERLYHANIRTDFGPLRWIFVTPQSHRIHHSSLPQHQDKNFGVVFSIWDRMFGTQYDGRRDEYPETGVADPHVPEVTSLTPWGLAKSFVAQLIYPFKGAANLMARSFVRTPRVQER